jgi:hypothetical protein
MTTNWSPGEKLVRQGKTLTKGIFTDGVHVVADGDLPDPLQALHQFCLGPMRFKAEWFQGDHYDITTPHAAARAAEAGAIFIPLIEIIRIRAKTGDRWRPEGWTFTMLGTGRDFADRAREIHGDVMEQITGNRTWRPNWRASIEQNRTARQDRLPPRRERPRVVADKEPDRGTVGPRVIRREML